MPDAVLPTTNQPYREALDTRRYDIGGSTQWLIADHYVLATRFSASTQQYEHQFGQSGEHDTHELLFGEVSLRGPPDVIPGESAQRQNATRTAQKMSHGLRTPTSRPACCCKTT